MAIFVILGVLVFFHQEIGILGAPQMRFELGPALAKSGPGEQGKKVKKIYCAQT